MKRASIYFIAASTLLFSLGACVDDEIIIDDFSVSFDFKLRDQLGVPFTAFQQGETINFTFQIINNSKKEITFQSMDTEEFMKVYILDTLSTNLPISLGKPYTDIFCSGQLSILPDDTLSMEIPWVADTINFEGGHIFCGIQENTDIPSGYYQTKFETAFNFIVDNEIRSTEPQSFDIIFDINSCEGKFQDKPLDKIRSCIKGTWNFYLEEGGFGGAYIVHENAFVKFKMHETADSIIWIDNNLFTREQIEWIYDEDEFGNRFNFKMHKVGSSGLIVIEIRNDTLRLRDIVVEPFTYYMNRISVFD